MRADDNENPLNDSARFVEFLTRLNYETYAVLAGLREEANLSEIKKSYADLYDKPKVLAERETFLSAASPPERRLSLLRLLERSTNYLSTQTQELDDEIETWKLRAGVEFEGEKIPYQMVQTLLRNLPERGRRLRLGEASFQVMLAVRPKVLARRKSACELVNGLGYESYAAAYAEWKQLPVARLAELAATSLDKTLDAYRRGLERYARELTGVGADEVSWFDFPRLLRGAGWDKHFPAEGILPALRATARDLGVGLDRHGNIRLDLEPRPNKTPRAFCAAVRVPEEIYLVAKPSGGHRDYEEVFHEAGHAFHFALTEPALPWELRLLADDTVAETFAYLTASLLRSEEYLVSKMGMSDADATAFVAYTNFIELYMFRRYCAKTLYEVELDRRPACPLSRGLYASCMKRALCIDVPDDFGVIDTDDGLYALQYLSAWFLEASLRAHLVEAFGRNWFELKEAGAFLRSLWKRGATDTPETLLAALGEQAISEKPLLASFGIE